MVAIGRALMSNPELILLDELSLGLAPVVIKDIYAMLPTILKGGMSAILVEQDVDSGPGRLTATSSACRRAASRSRGARRTSAASRSRPPISGP